MSKDTIKKIEKAIENGDVVEFERLIKDFSEINIKDSFFGHNFLHLACDSKNPSIELIASFSFHEKKPVTPCI